MYSIIKFEVEKMITKNGFRKYAVIIAFLLLSTAVAAPLTQSKSLRNIEKIVLGATKNEGSPEITSLGLRDFSITIHRIKKEDSIDPAKGSANWKLYMFVNGQRKTLDKDGDDVIIDKTITWENIVSNDTTALEIKFELLEKDLGYWPDEHDIADISAHVGGGKDNSKNFDSCRGAVFIRTYNLKTGDWMPEDENNDYLKIDDQSSLKWFITSGNFDGSTRKDENDATIWFNVFVENTPPYPPEKPSGPNKGDINVNYTFTTKCKDPDGDEIKYGWDWDGDSEVDELTDYYDSWETCSITHAWSKPGIYYVKVVAVDKYGMISKWSDILIVEINGPGGKNGFKKEKWALGHAYTVYLDHQNTQELIRTIKKGGMVVTAVAALIAAIATAYGVPIDPVTAAKIAVAIINLGAATIDLMDRGRGIYFKTYILEILGTPVYPMFTYIWSQ